MQRLFNATQLSQEWHWISREPPEKWNSSPATHTHTGRDMVQWWQQRCSTSVCLKGVQWAFGMRWVTGWQSEGWWSGRRWWRSTSGKRRGGFLFWTQRDLHFRLRGTGWHTVHLSWGRDEIWRSDVTMDGWGDQPTRQFFLGPRPPVCVPECVCIKQSCIICPQTKTSRIITQLTVSTYVRMMVLIQYVSVCVISVPAYVSGLMTV